MYCSQLAETASGWCWRNTTVWDFNDILPAQCHQCHKMALCGVESPGEAPESLYGSAAELRPMPSQLGPRLVGIIIIHCWLRLSGSTALTVQDRQATRPGHESRPN